MKCPRCGFRNLPGTKFCGACGTDLSVQTSTTFEPFYPPRAWGRKFRQPHPEVETVRNRWRRWFPFRRPDLNPTETLQQRAEQQRMRRLIWLTAIRSFAGLIPGLGLLRERRTKEGWRLFCAFLACIAIAVICWRNFLSNIALFAMVALSIYSVGATFFEAWQRNNLPTLPTFQRISIWLTVVSLFFWLWTIGSVTLNIWFGTASVPFGVTNDPVIESGNLLLYSRLERHLTNIKPNDYVVFDGTSARNVGYNYGDFVIYFGGLISGRVISKFESVNGLELTVEVPIFVGGRLVWVQTIVPMNAVRGKIIAVLNPPSRRRWLQ